MNKTIYSIIELAISTILIIVGVFAIINLDLIKDFIFTVIIGFYGIIIVSFITSSTVVYITSENKKPQ